MKSLETHLKDIAPLEERSKEYENIIISLRSIIGEHLDTGNELYEIFSNYSDDEISRTFNPPDIFEDINYSPDEVLKRAKILALYYRIDLPQELTMNDYEHNLKVFRAPYLLTEKFLNEVKLSRDGLELTPLEESIINSKNKFLHENAFNSARYFGIPEELTRNKEEFNIELNGLYNFIYENFEKLQPNIQLIYFKIYEKFLPVKGVEDGRTYYHLFDTELLEFNPNEFNYILILLEEIRKTMPEFKNFNSWYEAFNNSRKKDNKIS